MSEAPDKREGTGRAPGTGPSILFLIDALYGRGGTEVHLYELSRRLAAHGYGAIVCNLSGKQEMVDAIAAAGVETWPEVIGRLYMPAGRATARAIIRRAAGRNIRAIHTFHFKSDWLGVRAARMLHCPLISSRRDIGFQQNGPRRRMYRWINRHTDAFIAPSAAVKDSILNQGGARADDIRLIYNGLDAERFSIGVDRAEARGELGVPLDALLVGVVGRMWPVKGHAWLVRAVRRLVDTLPDVHLVLLGDGSEEENLRALAAELGVAGHVTFAGYGRDIPRALAALDVFALPSLSEGMSNAIIEAMAAGRPVVATRVGGNPECVVDGETGFIVPPADDAALADRIGFLLTHPDRARAMGEAGRARRQALFDMEEMVRQTVELYDSLGCRSREELSGVRA